MQGYGIVFGVLLALLVGLAAGKAWERYKLVEGRWIDRRRVRQSPHFILGLNHLVAGQVDLAIEELERAAQLNPDALELRLVLGNLHREKGQVGRAILEHQALLQRPRLHKIEHANVLLCLVNLEKLQEDQHQWQEAYVTRRRLAQIAGPPDQPKSQLILAFLENELGLQALKEGRLEDAIKRFEAAVELDQRVIPAYLHLGDAQRQLGDLPGAAATWERAIEVAPDRAYLSLGRLEQAYETLDQPERFAERCRALTQAAPREWRARAALARHLSHRGQPSRALELLFDALEHNPHAIAIHQAIWGTLSLLDLPKQLVARYIDITRQSVFYLDPHVCMRCRYRSTELIWQCPHCHEWNTFVEERITPATDTEAEIPAALVQ
jgi:lipopolysaccharide biosynthesis regulator YciM